MIAFRRVAHGHGGLRLLYTMTRVTEDWREEVEEEGEVMYRVDQKGLAA